MDEHSAELLNNLIDSQVATLRRASPAVSSTRGGSLGRLVDLLVDSAEAQAHDLTQRLASADPGERPALGRKLIRCRTRLNVAHLLVADYAADVSRQDIPTGLLCLIDALVTELLPDTSDPLIHLNEQRMYSTLSLNGRAARLLNDSSLATDVGVVVFNLPALDPGNVLYAPILAHEVAHTMVTHGRLLTELYSGADLQALDHLFTTQFQRDSSADAGEWKQRLSKWIQELLCDAIATRLTGPSFILASAAFLPATSMTGSLSSHPFPVDRLDLCREQLTSLGWDDYLTANYPTIMTWLASLGTNPPGHSAGGAAQTSTNNEAAPQETFLRQAVRLLAGDVIRVATDHVHDPLDPHVYRQLCDELNEHVAAGIPPSRLSAGTPSSWDLVLAGWQTAIASRGETPSSISSAAEDRPFNEFLVKALEVARITEVWDET